MRIQDHSFEVTVLALLTVAKYLGINSELFALGSAMVGLGIGYRLAKMAPKTGP